jgi:glycosyltransferase involved in cell wall biosynthesis
MKIGFLIDRLNVGGVEKSAIQEVRACKNLGVSACLMVLSRRSVVEGAHADLLKGIEVVYLDDRLPKFLKFSFRIPGFAFFSLLHMTYALFLPFFVKKGEWDYIISHGSYTTLSALMLRKIRKIPYSIYYWDPINYIVQRVYGKKFSNLKLSIFLTLGRLVDKILVKNSDCVFVAADTHNDYLGRYISHENIVVVHPGTPLGTPTTNKDPHVLMVTTWKEGKHPEYVFDLVKAYPKMHVKMVGGWIDPKMRKAFENQRHKFGFDENIELCGEANEEQLAVYYPKAALHLTTNLEKGFGMPVLEAAACGTVSIVPKGSGVCSVLEHGVDAYFTNERNTEEIVGYIKKLLENPNLARKMGKAAFDKVKTGHTWEVHTKTILDKVGIS